MSIIGSTGRLRGEGNNGELVKGAFEIPLEENLKIMAMCGFAAVYWRRYPEQQLVAASASD